MQMALCFGGDRQLGAWADVGWDDPPHVSQWVFSKGRWEDRALRLGRQCRDLRPVSKYFWGFFKGLPWHRMGSSVWHGSNKNGRKTIRGKQSHVFISTNRSFAEVVAEGTNIAPRASRHEKLLSVAGLVGSRAFESIKKVDVMDQLVKMQEDRVKLRTQMVKWFNMVLQRKFGFCIPFLISLVLLLLIGLPCYTLWLFQERFGVLRPIYLNYILNFENGGHHWLVFSCYLLTFVFWSLNPPIVRMMYWQILFTSLVMFQLGFLLGNHFLFRNGPNLNRFWFGLACHNSPLNSWIQKCQNPQGIMWGIF